MAPMMLAVPTLSFGTQTQYPLEIINCGVKQTFTKPPERAVVSQRTALPFPTPNALLPCLATLTTATLVAARR